MAVLGLSLLAYAVTGGDGGNGGGGSAKAGWDTVFGQTLDDGLRSFCVDRFGRDIPTDDCDCIADYIKTHYTAEEADRIVNFGVPTDHPDHRAWLRRVNDACS